MDFIPGSAAFFQAAPGKPDLFKFKFRLSVQWGIEGQGRLRLQTSQQLPPPPTKDSWQRVGKMTSNPSLCPLPELSIDCGAKNSPKGLFGDSATHLMSLSLELSQGASIGWLKRV